MFYPFKSEHEPPIDVSFEKHFLVGEQEVVCVGTVQVVQQAAAFTTVPALKQHESLCAG